MGGKAPPLKGKQKLICAVFKLKRKATATGTVPSPQGFKPPVEHFSGFLVRKHAFGNWWMCERLVSLYGLVLQRRAQSPKAVGIGLDNPPHTPPLSSWWEKWLKMDEEWGVKGGSLHSNTAKWKPKQLLLVAAAGFLVQMRLHFHIWPVKNRTLTTKTANLNTWNTISGYTRYKTLTTEITLTSFFATWQPFSSGAFHHLHQQQIHIFFFFFLRRFYFNCLTFFLHLAAGPFFTGDAKQSAVCNPECSAAILSFAAVEYYPKRKNIAR